LAGTAAAESQLSFSSRVGYGYELSRGNVRREAAGLPPAAPVGQLRERPDLKFASLRHVMRAELAANLWDRFEIGLRLPVVLTDSTDLSAAEGRAAAPSVTDGILPIQGFDSGAMGAPTDPGSELLLRGPTRRGLDALFLDVSYAISSQARTPWLPTWTVGATGELSMGSLARFDALNPTAERGVAKGVHALWLSTRLSRQAHRFFPFLDVFARIPLAVRSGSALNDAEAFLNRAPAAPPKTIGASGGASATIWKNRARGHDFRARLASRFEFVSSGRDLSPVWEAVALGGDVIRNGPLVLQGGAQPISNAGATDVEDHLQGSLALEVATTLWTRFDFALRGEFGWVQSHRLTTAPRGQNGDNLYHVPVIDRVGRRYRLANATHATVAFTAAVSF
jgi:hypothetical protein